MVRDRPARRASVCPTIVPTMKCARRVAQRGATSSFWNNVFVSRRILDSLFEHLTNAICIEQVETLLKNQDSTDTTKETARQDSTTAYVASTLQQALPNSGADFLNTTDRITAAAPELRTPAADSFQNGGVNGNAEGEFSWEMIGLGLEEPLPPQDVMDDL